MDKDLHYYIHFSSKGKFFVNTLTFRKKSDIKSPCYKNLKYYKSRERAEKIAAMLNKKVASIFTVQFANIACNTVAEIDKLTNQHHDYIENMYAESIAENLTAVTMLLIDKMFNEPKFSEFIGKYGVLH